VAIRGLVAGRLSVESSARVAVSTDGLLDARAFGGRWLFRWWFLRRWRGRIGRRCSVRICFRHITLTVGHAAGHTASGHTASGSRGTVAALFDGDLAIHTLRAIT